MMKAVTYILENDSALQSLLGQNTSGTKYKVYPVVAPETERAPYCVCRIFSKEEGAKDCGYIWTFEISTYATSYDSVSALNDAVIDAMKSEGAGTVNSESFGWAVFDNEVDDFEKDHDLYVKRTTFRVHGL